MRPYWALRPLRSPVRGPLVTGLFTAAFVVDYVVLGGGNARHLASLPKGGRLGTNANAFKGGFRLWKE